MTCPSGIAPWFDSCRLICVNDPNAVCGNPGDQCQNIVTTTTDSTTVDSTTVDWNETTTTGDGGIPTAPGKTIFINEQLNF